MLAIFFLEFNLKDCIEVQQKKKKSLSCVHVRQKTWKQVVSRRSCAVRAKKCTKKRAELLFCWINLLLFCRSRWRRRRRYLSSLLFSNVVLLIRERERGTRKWKLGTKQRTGNEVTDRAWVQLKFCSHFFHCPVLVPRFSKILFVTLRQKKLSQEKKRLVTIFVWPDWPTICLSALKLQS